MRGQLLIGERWGKLSSEYRFLAHEIFWQQYTEFLDKHEDSLQSLRAQIEGAVNDPLNFGKPLTNVQNSKLRGRIRRYHVHGRSGFRLICLIDSANKAVVGVFLSSKVRSAFDYDEVPWEDYAIQIYDDLVNKRWKKFKKFAIAD